MSADHDHPSHPPFGPEEAAAYDARTAHFSGYQAMHPIIAAAMSASLKDRAASVLCVGVGTGQELLPYARFGAPTWRFTGVDPSPHMLAVARERLSRAGLLERTELHATGLQALPDRVPFDGAQMVGALHHVGREEARVQLLNEIARRLKPGAPFIIGERFEADPMLTAIESEQLRVGGVSAEALAHHHQAPDFELPPSDEAFFALMRQAGFNEPRQIFAALTFKVFLLRAPR